VEFLRSWWRQPFDYQWTVNYHRVRGTLAVNRVSVGLWCCLYSVGAFCVLTSPAGPRGGPAIDILVSALAVACAVIGIVWIAGRWPRQWMTRLFVVYTDVGVAVVLFTFADLVIAMMGCSLFSVTGAHVTAFHSPRWLLGHLIFATAVTLSLYGCVMLDPAADKGIASALLMALLPVLLAAPIIMQSGLLDLREDANDAFRDHLTKLRNRRGLEAGFHQLQYSGIPVGLAVLMLDIDGFKKINDKHGHSGGDAVLEIIAARLVDVAGAHALIARVGGEEFAIALVGTPEQAIALAHRARSTLHDPDDRHPITVSVGVAVATHQQLRANKNQPSTATLRSLLKSADTAMYEAKQRGGNAVSVSSDLDGATC
jgi:diguanylate cyclase (GGDEF)-like protein